MAATADNIDPTKPRRRRRWWLRIPLILIALAVTVVVLAQIFLWTDYPRQIAESQVQRILRVRASIKSVSIGWLGRTRIEGVSLTLPFETEPFVKIDRINATHASLPLIAFTQDLRDVQIEGIDFVAKQNADGRWNIEQLRPPPATTQPTVAQRPSNPLADLPSLHATNVRAALIRKDGKRLDVPVVSVDFVKHDGLTATIKANSGEMFSVEGEVIQSAALPQELRAKFNGLPGDVASFFGIKPPTPLSANVEWSGRLTAGGVAGSLRLVDVAAANARLAGRIEVAAGDRITFRPADFSAKVEDVGPLDLRADAGTIAYDGGITVTGLVGTLNGGRFAVDGKFDPKTLAADIAARWDAVTQDTLATTGSAHVTTSRLFNGRIRVDASVKGGARIPAGEATGSVAINAELASLENVYANLIIDPLTWTPSDSSPPIVTPRLRGDLTEDGPVIRFEAQNADESVGSLAALGGLDRETMTFWANLDASNLLLPSVEARGVKGPIDVSLAAEGTKAFIRVTRAYAKIDKATGYVVGDYDFTRPRPVSATAWMWYEKPVTEDEAAQLNTLEAIAQVDGTLSPRELRADVDLKGSQLVFAGRPIGDVALKLAADVGEEDATVRSQELDALGGRWSLRGRWSAHSSAPPTVVVNFRDIPAKNIGAAIDRDDLGGTIERGSAIIRLPSTRLNRINLVATARGSKLSAGPFRAESLVLEATLNDGRFQLLPELYEEGGKIAAKIVGDVRFAAPVHADVELTNWPAPYLISTTSGAERFRERASGTASAEFTVQTRDISAETALQGTIERGNTKLADFKIAGTLKNKLVTLTNATLDTLDGTMAANGTVDLTNFNATTLETNFTDLTPARLAWSNPVVGEIAGRLSGTFSIRPSSDPRALGPTEIALKVFPDGVSFRKIEVGPLDVLAYADIKSGSTFRFVSDHVTLNVAGGTIEPFGRLSSEPDRGMAQLITAQFKQIDLGQIAKAVDDDGKEVVGKVSGRVQLYGQTTRLDTLAGDASIDIADSDLGNFGPIEFLYNALSIGTAGSKPIGTGNILLRFSDDAVTIDQATYFNRGVYVNAFGAVRGLSKGMEAGVDHVIIVGSAQPLAAVKLPFFGDLNDALSALGSSLTTVEVTGPAKEPKMELVPITALADSVQKILLGKTQGEGK